MILLCDLLRLLDTDALVQIYTDAGIHSDVMSIESLVLKAPAALQWKVTQLQYEEPEGEPGRFVIVAH